MTPEMRQWLTDNRDDYEFYMMHRAFHAPLWRIKMISAPVIPDDFRREEYALVMAALIGATKIMGTMGHDVPTPPDREWMRTYVEVAARQLGSDDEDVAGALRLVSALQDEKYKDQHYCVEPYFEGWYGSVRAKRAAAELMKVDVPDVHGQIGAMQQALASAHSASVADEEDPMEMFIHSQDLERVERKSTGISGLDECLNGGWGQFECYLLFGGTGGGKSIAAAQCAWNEATTNNGWPLIVSTELLPREYSVRIVSNAAGIPIGKVQDCENVAQVVQSVGADPSLMYKLNKVEEVLRKVGERIRIHKVSPEEGMDSRLLLEREVMKYEEKMGRKPTWICLDWLGSVADIGSGGNSTSERAMIWEGAANSCVKFAESSGIPTLVLAQAVNDAQLKSVLSISDIGISKGIGKNMVAVIGVTNAMDKKGVTAAVRGESEMPKKMINDDQLFCVCKARKGEGRNIPVRRDFRFQRFTARPRDDG